MNILGRILPRGVESTSDQLFSAMFTVSHFLYNFLEAMTKLMTT